MDPHYYNNNQNPNGYYNYQNPQIEGPNYQNQYAVPNNQYNANYPMGAMNPLDVQREDLNYQRERGVTLSPNVKNCLAITAVISFLVFIILLFW